MKMIVIDHNEQRKAVIEAAMQQEGIVLIERNNHNSMNNLDLLSESDGVVLFDSSDTTIMAMQTSGKHLVVITPFVELKSQLPSHVIVLSADAMKNDDELMTQIVSQVNQLRYQTVFPESINDNVNAMLCMAKKAAKSSASILIQGDTGTGKEVLAKYIHYNSPYSAGPFIAINCAAMPETMIEAILFGYEKGSFTSAVASYAGKFEQANHGTILLDEIGEMSLPLQAKLLRVLQEREIERIGGKGTLKIDIRVIAATNKNLEAEIKMGRFRQDLFYRLNVMTLHCLPLRERQNDILLLAKHFLIQYQQEMNLSKIVFTRAVENMMLNYSWPGNIRELDNVIHRALILDEDGIVDIDDLNLPTEGKQDDHSHSNKDMGLRGREAEVIVSMLKETNGSRTVTAKRLQISPRTLRHKILKLKQIGMDVP